MHVHAQNQTHRLPGGRRPRGPAGRGAERQGRHRHTGSQRSARAQRRRAVRRARVARHGRRRGVCGEQRAQEGAGRGRAGCRRLPARNNSPERLNARALVWAKGRGRRTRRRITTCELLEGAEIDGVAAVLGGPRWPGGRGAVAAGPGRAPGCAQGPHRKCRAAAGRWGGFGEWSDCLDLGCH